MLLYEHCVLPVWYVTSKLWPIRYLDIAKYNYCITATRQQVQSIQHQSGLSWWNCILRMTIIIVMYCLYSFLSLFVSFSVIRFFPFPYLRVLISDVYKPTFHNFFDYSCAKQREIITFEGFALTRRIRKIRIIIIRTQRRSNNNNK